MAEAAVQQQEHEQPEHQEQDAVAEVVVDPDEAEKKKPQPSPQGLPAMTFTIWPPSQRTRDAVISRLVETLSKESILSKRYGAIPGDEAAAVARQIEEEAFAAAAAASPAPASADAAAADDLDIGTLQLYSREISKRMLSAVKARASAASSSPPSTPPIETPPPASAAAPSSGDEAPSGESETSHA
ncbi:hypothetical protein Taro_020182 [Colocasia esculenta]|uniref:WPP domain-containing protein n=1 Tax=Colocasia esculenta TaxID=4460 RepID=A0A843V1M5_COLES|nr:hypothetical protein [Colocasia esculenta]